MKLIYAADIHGAFEKVKNLLFETVADAYVISGDRFEQQGLDLLEGAVDVSRVDQLHARPHSICLEKSH